MRIGIHKLGFANGLVSKEDKNGMFAEVLAIMNILDDLSGHDVSYVYTDQKPYEPRKYFDTIFVFNGYENSTSNLKTLRHRCYELNYILTDTRFYNGREGHEEVDNYFVQSPFKMYDKPTYNSHIHKLPLFNTNAVIYEIKVNKLIFGGSVRDREDKIIEYVLRPNTNYHLNFELLGINNRLPVYEYMERLKHHRYGIVIINPLDVEIGNITWRYYEYIANDVVTFVDKDSDPNNLLLSEGHFLYVSSYKEMVVKQNMINSVEGFRDKLLEEQRRKINVEDITGETFVSSLLKGRELNVR